MTTIGNTRADRAANAFRIWIAGDAKARGAMEREFVRVISDIAAYRELHAYPRAIHVIERRDGRQQLAARQGASNTVSLVEGWFGPSTAERLCATSSTWPAWASGSCDSGRASCSVGSLPARRSRSPIADDPSRSSHPSPTAARSSDSAWLARSRLLSGASTTSRSRCPFQRGRSPRPLCLRG